MDISISSSHGLTGEMAELLLYFNMLLFSVGIVIALVQLGAKKFFRDETGKRVSSFALTAHILSAVYAGALSAFDKGDNG